MKLAINLLLVGACHSIHTLKDEQQSLAQQESERYRRHNEINEDPFFFSQPHKSGKDKKVTIKDKLKSEKLETSGDLIPIKQILSDHEYFDNELFT